jgi:type II secretion system protein I
MVRILRKVMTISQTGPRNSCQSGRSIPNAFTLIEVLISLVILSTGIVLVLRAFGTSLSALRQSRDAMLANMFIGETISDTRLKALERGEVGSTVDTVEIRGPDNFAGELRIMQVQVSPDGSNTLNRVLVTVWRDRAGPQYSASTFITASKREKVQ